MKAWVSNRERRRAANVPDGQGFAAKGAPAKAMVTATRLLTYHFMDGSG
ncbi:hypothetical protein [Streptomyces sp. rh207]|nr:hypothetical protein [Streptomyces sp. rh207]